MYHWPSRFGGNLEPPNRLHALFKAFITLVPPQARGTTNHPRRPALRHKWYGRPTGLPSPETNGNPLKKSSRHHVWAAPHGVGLLTLGSIHYLKLCAHWMALEIIHTYLGLGPTTSASIDSRSGRVGCLVAHSLTWPNHIWLLILFYWQLVVEPYVVGSP